MSDSTNRFKRSTIFLSLFSLLLLILVMGVISLPSLLSTAWGNQKISQLINSNIRGKVVYKRLAISWLGDQSLQGVEIFDPNQKPIASLDSAIVRTPLWKLIFHRGKEGNYELLGLSASLTQEPDGLTNLQSSLSCKNEIPSSSQKNREFPTINIKEANANAVLNPQQNSYIKLSGKTFLQGKKGFFQADIKLGESLAFQAEASNLPVVLLDEVLAVSYPNLKGILSHILGENLNLHLQAKQTVDEEGNQQHHFQAKGEGSIAQVNLAGKLENFEKILLKEPLTIDYQPTLQTQALAAKIGGLEQWPLQENLQIHLFIDKNENAIHLSDLSNLKLKGIVKINQLNLNKQISLIDLSLPWEIDAPRNIIALNANGISKWGSENGTVQGNFYLTNWIEGTQLNVAKMQIESSLNVTKFPTPFLEETFHQNDLVALLGPSFDIHLKAKNTSLNPLPTDFFLAFQGQNLSGKGAFNIKNGFLTLVGEPASLKLAMSPQQLNQFRQRFLNQNKELSETNSNSPFQLELNIEAVSIPLKIEALKLDQVSLLLNMHTQGFPIKRFSHFLKTENDIPEKIAAVLGNTFDANIHLQLDHMQGPVQANVKGDKGQIFLDAQINQGILTLNQNFQSQTTLTPEFGKYILKDIFPLAKGVIDSDNPLTVIVGAEGFRLPIRNFNINDVEIKTASLEMGKVRFKNEGQLGTILSLFKNSSSDIIPVWFTPLYFNMHKGLLNLHRMDMLVMDSYPIASWGTINFPQDKINMRIGLTGQSLLKGFNISGLGDDFVLQIPFKGPIGHASIDKKNASAKIAALVASNQGPQGLIIGTALHIASGALTEEKAPPPTTNPFPWTLEEPKATPSNEANPLQQVGEKATSLIRNLLPLP